MKLHAGHIEVAVAKLLNWRIYTIVPNVSWGLGLNHECDMLALDTRNRFTEIEIKISAPDLKRDFLKQHGHNSKHISRLVYAMPEPLFDKYSHLIPSHCGVITVTYDNGPGQRHRARWRVPGHHKYKEPVPDGIIRKFMSLGCMRIWSLKEHNNRKRQ